MSVPFFILCNMRSLMYLYVVYILWVDVRKWTEFYTWVFSKNRITVSPEVVLFNNGFEYCLILVWLWYISPTKHGFAVTYFYWIALGLPCFNSKRSMLALVTIPWLSSIVQFILLSALLLTSLIIPLTNTIFNDVFRIPGHDIGITAIR